MREGTTRVQLVLPVMEGEGENLEERKEGRRDKLSTTVTLGWTDQDQTQNLLERNLTYLGNRGEEMSTGPVHPSILIPRGTSKTQATGISRRLVVVVTKELAEVEAEVVAGNKSMHEGRAPTNPRGPRTGNPHFRLMGGERGVETVDKDREVAGDSVPGMIRLQVHIGEKRMLQGQLCGIWRSLDKTQSSHPLGRVLPETSKKV